MAKDRRARDDGRITIMALGNLIGAIVDTMQDEDIPADTVLGFLNRLELLNEATLWGTPGELMAGLTAVLRRVVAAND